ncbi:MAG TPA: hypothetical protein VGR64_04910, partial [Terracidiphilus sp.]|nr:hypothetical protein [Terracidiphilus sp.]
MSARLFIPLVVQRRMAPAALLLCLGAGLIPARAQSATSPSSPATQAAPDAAAASSASTVLDRVVAVVNNQAILQSDLNQEMRLSVLEPDLPGRNRGPETPESALRRLIARALIRQQIREEDAQTAEPTEKEVSDRLEELRRQLPACARANCASAAGWQAFLAQH